MKRIGTGALVLLAALVCVGLLRGTEPARAQDEQAKGSLVAHANGANPDMKGQALVTFIKAGAIVHQAETRLGGEVSLYGAPTGSYDIRVEGEGMTTVVKRGLTVSSGQINGIIAIMRSGQGVKVIQYEPTAVTRDELAGRLAKLEAAVEELKKK